MNTSKTVVGIDIAKRVFQLHWLDPETGEIVSRQLKREQFLAHFANRAPCLIGMEACGGAQHWASGSFALSIAITFQLLMRKRLVNDGPGTA